MYYKIQPEQIQIHDFSSPSGDINFSIGSNYIYSNLSRALTGDFNFIGTISINGIKVQSSDSSNSLSGDNSFIFGGTDNQVSGTKNLALNSNFSNIGGTGNSIINSYLSTIDNSSSSNTIIGGKSANILANTTGAMILKDSVDILEESNTSNSLTISFGSGTFIKRGGLNIENGGLKITNGNLNIEGQSLRVGSLGSGLFSGDLNVLGTPYNNGIRLATIDDVTSSVPTLSNVVYSTGDQTISGVKTYTDNLIIRRTNNQLVLATGADDGGSVTITTSPNPIAGNNIFVLPNITGNAEFIMSTGNQNIHSLKNFTTRPTVSGIGVALLGEGAGGTVDVTNLVTTNTTQTITANKEFSLRPTVNGTGVLLQGEATIGGTIDTTNLVNTTGNQDVGGLKNFTIRPTVGGVNVALTSELGGVGDTTSLVTTGTAQTINATKTFTANQIFQGSTNQLTFRTGDAGFKINITAPNIPADRTYTVPNVGGNATFVMTTGNQDIGGTKDFKTRPTVNASDIALLSEVPTDAVTISANQTINSTKTFVANQVFQAATNQLTIRTGSAGSRIDITAPTITTNRVYTIPDVGNSSFVMNTGNQNIGGTKDFKTRPTVNGTGVLLVGEAGNGVTSDGTITSIQSISYASYQALVTKNPQTLYVVTYS